MSGAFDLRRTPGDHFSWFQLEINVKKIPKTTILGNQALTRAQKLTYLHFSVAHRANYFICSNSHNEDFKHDGLQKLINNFGNRQQAVRTHLTQTDPGRGGQTGVTPDQTSFDRTHVPCALELHGLEKASSALSSGQCSWTCLIRGHFGLELVWSEADSSALRAHNDLRAHTRLIRAHFGLWRSDQRQFRAWPQPGEQLTKHRTDDASIFVRFTYIQIYASVDLCRSTLIVLCFKLIFICR